MTAWSARHRGGTSLPGARISQQAGAKRVYGTHFGAEADDPGRPSSLPRPSRERYAPARTPSPGMSRPPTPPPGTALGPTDITPREPLTKPGSGSLPMIVVAESEGCSALEAMASSRSLPTS
jgi:hypothetical protein